MSFTKFIVGYCSSDNSFVSHSNVCLILVVEKSNVLVETSPLAAFTLSFKVRYIYDLSLEPKFKTD